MKRVVLDKKIGNSGEKAVVQNPPVQTGYPKGQTDRFHNQAQIWGQGYGNQWVQTQFGKNGAKGWFNQGPPKGNGKFGSWKGGRGFGNQGKGHFLDGRGNGGRGGPGVPPPTQIPAIPSQAPPLVL